jgi:hypothetical protein
MQHTGEREREREKDQDPKSKNGFVLEAGSYGYGSITIL